MHKQEWLTHILTYHTILNFTVPKKIFPEYKLSSTIDNPVLICDPPRTNKLHNDLNWCYVYPKSSYKFHLSLINRSTNCHGFFASYCNIIDRLLNSDNPTTHNQWKIWINYMLQYKSKLKTKKSPAAKFILLLGILFWTTASIDLPDS